MYPQQATGILDLIGFIAHLCLDFYSRQSYSTIEATMIKSILFAGATLLLSSSVFAGTSSPPNAKAYIISPANGEVVSSPFKVKFGLHGMGVAPAGVDKANTGHHHLIINTQLSSFTRAIPNDKNHKHFGGGQTETTLELPPGDHTLQLVLGDKKHVPHNKPVASEVITITVK